MAASKDFGAGGSLNQVSAINLPASSPSHWCDRVWLPHESISSERFRLTKTSGCRSVCDGAGSRYHGAVGDQVGTGGSARPEMCLEN